MLRFGLWDRRRVRAGWVMTAWDMMERRDRVMTTTWGMTEMREGLGIKRTACGEVLTARSKDKGMLLREEKRRETGEEEVRRRLSR